jgi:uncharacterized protein (TIGR04222 family)
MNVANQVLFDRLQAFEIDEPGAELTFGRRLARENGWRPEYAERVIVEYKKFLYLAMVAGHVVSPSEQVDQAWHMHLVYTRSYWNELCGKVLGRALHHTPTQGGAVEQAKYVDLYNQTLASYRQLIGPPPQDIWPPAEVRFGDDLHHVSVNTRRYWIVPKPRWPRTSFNSQGTSLGVLGMVGLPLAAATWNPLDWRGPEFLLAYAVWAIAAALLALFVRLRLAPRNDDFDAPKIETLDPYEIAVLAAGPDRAVEAAFASMVHAGTLQIATEPTSTRKPVRVRAATTSVQQGKPLPADAPPIERALHGAAASPAKSFAPLRRAGLPIAKELSERLKERELLQAGPPPFHCVLAAAIMAAPLLPGSAKIAVGISRGRPVAFLALLCAATVIASLLFLFVRSRLSARGKAALERVRLTSASPTQLSQPTVSALSPPDLATAIGLFGVAALAAGPLAPVHAMLPRSCGGGDVSTSFGGCGGGSGCSGGGGCGGGGCGGCGGG